MQCTHSVQERHLNRGAHIPKPCAPFVQVVATQRELRSQGAFSEEDEAQEMLSARLKALGPRQQQQSVRDGAAVEPSHVGDGARASNAVEPAAGARGEGEQEGRAAAGTGGGSVRAGGVPAVDPAGASRGRSSSRGSVAHSDERGKLQQPQQAGREEGSKANNNGASHGGNQQGGVDRTVGNQANNEPTPAERAQTPSGDPPGGNRGLSQAGGQAGSEAGASGNQGHRRVGPTVVQEGVRGGRESEVGRVSEVGSDREEEAGSSKEWMDIGWDVNRSGTGSGYAAKNTDSDCEEVIEVNAANDVTSGMTNDMTAAPLTRPGDHMDRTDLSARKPARDIARLSDDAGLHVSKQHGQGRVDARCEGRIDTIRDGGNNGDDTVVELAEGGGSLHAGRRRTLPPVSRAAREYFRPAHGAVMPDVEAPKSPAKRNWAQGNSEVVGRHNAQQGRIPQPQSNASWLTGGGRSVTRNSSGTAPDPLQAAPSARQVSGQGESFSGVVAEIQGGFRPARVPAQSFRSLPVIGSLTYRVPDGMQVPGSDAGQQDVSAFLRELRAVGAHGQTRRQDRVRAAHGHVISFRVIVLGGIGSHATAEIIPRCTCLESTLLHPSLWDSRWRLDMPIERPLCKGLELFRGCMQQMACPLALVTHHERIALCLHFYPHPPCF